MMVRSVLFAIVLAISSVLFGQEDCSTDYKWYKNQELELLKNPKLDFTTYFSHYNDTDILVDTKTFIQLLKAQGYIYKGRMLKADSVLNNLIVESIGAISHQLILETKYWKAISQFKQTKYSEALHLLVNVSNLCTEVDSTIFMKSKKVIGNISSMIGMTSSALENYQIAANYFERKQDSLNLISVRSDIANIYLRKNSNFKKRGIEYIFEVVEFYKRKNYVRQYARAKMNLVLKDELKFTDKLTTLDHVDSIFKANDDDYNSLKVQIQKANLYLENEDVPRSVELSLAVLNDAQTQGYKYRLAEAYGQLRNIYRTSGNDDLWLMYDTLAYQAYLDIKNYKKAAILANEVSYFFTDDQTAVDYHDSADQLEDLHEKKSNETRNLYLAYHFQSEEQEKEIAKTELEKSRIQIANYRLLLIISAIGLIFLIFIRFYFIRRKQLRERLILSEQRAEVEVKELVQGHQLEVMKTAIQSEEQVRQELASELHDGVGSDIAGLAIMSENEGSSYSEKLRNIYENLRRISHAMGLPSFGENTLVELLSKLLSRIYEDHQIRCKLVVKPDDEPLNIQEELTISVYRIIQELSVNMVKHANADEFIVKLELIDSELRVIVSDDGVGFNIDKNSTGMGLESIQRRVTQQKGKFVVQSASTNGTTVELVFSVQPKLCFEASL